MNVDRTTDRLVIQPEDAEESDTLREVIQKIAGTDTLLAFYTYDVEEYPRLDHEPDDERGAVVIAPRNDPGRGLVGWLWLAAEALAVFAAGWTLGALIEKVVQWLRAA